MRLLTHILVLGLLTFLSGQLSGQSVNIDMGSEHQVIRGFGGMNHTSWVTDLNEDQREKAFNNAPGNIGLSILRIHIDPDPNRFDDQVLTSRYALSQGALVFATPWNAPSELLDPDAEYSKVAYEHYDEYVNHLNGFNTFMSNNGVDLHAISVQNEPDYGEWTRWSSQEMVTFLKENAQNIENTVMAPESFQFRRPYTDSILNDPDAAANVDIIAGHIYGGGLLDYSLARQKGKEVWMTEHLTGSGSPEENDWALALDMGVEINDCMLANFNAYLWWYIRRFYSLIDDAGNITQKGYVMSQFTKFVRPGNIRVDASAEGVTGIETSAFKTDSSLVIVVINQNAEPVELSFSINNGAVDTLTKFTTSATKNVVNDGGVNVTDGSANASVDAYSVNTFTTHAQDGGKAGNLAPIADLGKDTVIIDEDGDATELISLDGTASTDADGTITNYAWSIDGVQVGWDETYSFNADIGNYKIILTVTDNDGATDIDTINITVESLFNTEMYFEAECGEVGSTWQLLTNAQASGGVYIRTTPGIESIGAPSENASDLLRITFTIEEAGPYKLWGRVRTPSANDDSFWVNMDDSPEWVLWNSIPASSDWHWDDVHNSNAGGQAVIYQLEPGEHTLTICFREDGADLDKLFLANNGSVPSGLGGDAQTGCVGLIEPLAHAGEDVVIPDLGANGIETVTLDGSQSDDPDGDIVTYSWREDGNEIASGITAEVELGLGSHDIVLVVTDDFGNTASDTITIDVVEVISPIANAGEDLSLPDIQADGEETIMLDGSLSTDPDGEIVDYSWLIDDVEIANGVTPEVDLPLGINVIVLVVTDNHGNTASDTVTVEIVEQILPVARAGNDRVLADTLGDGVETVILDGSQSSDEDGDIVSFSWIIADSVVASAVTGEIDLPVGNHEVVLLVMDDMGNTGSDTVNITILESPVGIDAMDILTNLRVYPNPFVDEVTIEYFLEKPGLVRIDLMDVTGRWMQSLVDSELIEGRHSILLNGQSLESGTYYLRFNCDNKNLGDKVLIKE